MSMSPTTKNSDPRIATMSATSVPGSSFYRDPSSGKHQVRFTFCKKRETLDAAETRLAQLQVRTSAPAL